MQNPPQESTEDERIALDAYWLFSQPEAPHLIVPVLREYFGLSAMQAFETICELGRIRKSKMLEGTPA